MHEGENKKKKLVSISWEQVLFVVGQLLPTFSRTQSINKHENGRFSIRKKRERRD